MYSFFEKSSRCNCPKGQNTVLLTISGPITSFEDSEVADASRNAEIPKTLIQNDQPNIDQDRKQTKTMIGSYLFQIF